ncbi:hypothetical protein [Herbaspirillum sp. B65]|uniref:hypothetical protein n=1 Tax=Herbaspirillum sp. B65 TaxID=137708 RepID=UPI0005C86EF7|nr:hypothetical protein [Herbaspirillum sp. B65]
MEATYHVPDAFRYSLNAFIRAVADVPDLLTKNLEKHKSAHLLIKPKIKELKASSLYSILKVRRNFIVHQGMLAVQSNGAVYTMEGPRIKLSFPFRVEVWESSDAAYERYKEACRKDKFWRGIGPDCDSSPAIVRTWLIPQIPGRDLLEVAFDAWSLVGNLISDAAIALGGDPIDLSMKCRHSPELVRIKRYSQHEFFMSVDGIDLDEEERKWKEQRSRQQEPGPD